MSAVGAGDGRRWGRRVAVCVGEAVPGASSVGLTLSLDMDKSSNRAMIKPILQIEEKQKHRESQLAWTHAPRFSGIGTFHRRVRAGVHRVECVEFILRVRLYLAREDPPPLP